MNASCPTCATIYTVKSGYAGLISCKCGVRFDAYSHIHKEMPPTIGRNLVPATTVQCIDMDQVETIESFETFDDVRSFSSRKTGRNLFSDIAATARRYSLIAVPEGLGFITVLVVAVCLLYGAVSAFASYRAIPAISAKPLAVAPIKTLPVPTPPVKDPAKIEFSAIELNMVGRDTYFLRANLINTGQSIANWPVIEVTLLSGGRDVGQKLVSPLEYLAGDISVGKVPAPSIEPHQIKQVRMNLAFQNDTSKAADYRMRAVYLEK